MKILITGAGGFIGNHLMQSLSNAKVDFTLFKGNILDIESCSESFDILIHLAAVLKPKDNEFQMYEANVIGTQKVIELCKRNNAKLIFLSTSGVYGESEELVLKEESSDLYPGNSYSVSKLLAEKLCENAYKLFGVTVVILRIFNVYGPNQKGNFILPDILNSIQNSEPIVLKTPNAVRDFVYIDDVVKAILQSLLLEGYFVFNIGSGVSLSVTGLIEKLENLICQKISIDFSKIKSQNQTGILANNSLAQKVLKWQPEIGIHEGLSRVLHAIGLLKKP